MRVGTYNVLGLRGYPKGEAQMELGSPESDETTEHFIRVFAELDCDVIGLQEGVSAFRIQAIARPMEYHLATFPSPTACPGHVLSRFAISESRIFGHMQPSNRFPPFNRTGGAALIEHSGGAFWFFVVHLYHRDMAVRNREADILRDRIAELLMVTPHAIVVGDFNCEIGERVHSHLAEAGFVNAVAESTGSLPVTVDTVGVEQRKAIDHIYLSPSLAPRLTAARVVRDPGFRHDGPQTEGLWVHSDHLPVVATLDWQ